MNFDWESFNKLDYDELPKFPGFISYDIISRSYDELPEGNKRKFGIKNGVITIYDVRKSNGVLYKGIFKARLHR